MLFKRLKVIQTKERFAAQIADMHITYVKPDKNADCPIRFDNL